jgi:hypothetical protein
VEKDKQQVSAESDLPLSHDEGSLASSMNLDPDIAIQELGIDMNVPSFVPYQAKGLPGTCAARHCFKQTPQNLRAKSVRLALIEKIGERPSVKSFVARGIDRRE